MLNRSPTATAHFSYSDPKPIEISSVSIVNILCRVNWDLVFANLPTPSFSLKFLFFPSENKYKTVYCFEAALNFHMRLFHFLNRNFVGLENVTVYCCLKLTKIPITIYK